MFCENCGKEIKEGQQFCGGCGRKQDEGEGKQRSVNQRSYVSGQTNSTVNVGNAGEQIRGDFQKEKGLVYGSIILSLFCSIAPLLKWITIPLYDTLSNWVTGDDSLSAYSLFGYLVASDTGSTDKMVSIVIFILAILAVIGMAFNIIYIAKSFTQKDKRFRYGTMGAWIMLILSLLFLIVVGGMSIILRIIKITFIPWLVLVLSIANLVIIRKIKRQ